MLPDINLTIESPDSGFTLDLSEYHVKHKVTVPCGGDIHPSAIRSIIAYLDSHYGCHPPVNDGYMGRDSTSFIWEWLITRNDDGITGTLPKRISRYLYRHYSVNLTDADMQFIGNTVYQNGGTENNITVCFDIDNLLDWNPGDFADPNSCYWNDRSPARVMLRQANGLAIRFYDLNNPRRGIGRAWIVPMSGAPEFLIYDAYGNRPLVGIARIMSTLLGKSYRRVGFTNNGSASGMLWINGGTAYLIGDDTAINGYPTNIDLALSIHCSECGRPTGNCPCVHPLDRSIIYCESCYRKYRLCEHCNQWVLRIDTMTVYTRLTCITYCERCDSFHTHGNDHTGMRCTSCIDTSYFMECRECHRMVFRGGIDRESGLCVQCHVRTVQHGHVTRAVGG